MILQIYKNLSDLQTFLSASDHVRRVAPWWNTAHFQLSEFIFLTRHKVALDISDITYPAYVRLISKPAPTLYTTGLYWTFLYLFSTLFPKCVGLCSAINWQVIYTQLWELLLGLFVRFICLDWPPLWSSGQSFWLQIQRSRFRSPALPDFLSSSGSGTGSTQPREVNWGATWIEKVAAPGLENRD